MGKITIEDCLEIIPNRFELTLSAANRARELHQGAMPTIEVKRAEKHTVTALKEIASGQFSKEKLNDLKKFRK